MNWRLLLTTTAICLGGSLHFGIQLTVLNPTEAIFQNFINSTHYRHYGTYLTETSYRIVWSVILSLLYAGTFVGTFPVSKLADTIGRVRTFYISAAFILLGLVCQILSKVVISYELLALGRFSMGIGCGMTVPLQIIYLNEISPFEQRGFIGGISGMFSELGYVIGGVLALPVTLGTENLWLYMFVLEAVPLFVLFFTLPFLPESPMYLIIKQDLEAAKKSLTFFGHKNIDWSMKEIQTELLCLNNELTWRDLWRRGYLRRSIFLCLIVSATLILSGIVVVDFFSTKTLVDVGLSMESAQYASIGIFSGTLLASILGGFFIEKTGSRRLLLITTFSLIIFNISLMVFSLIHHRYDQIKWSGVASVVACCALTLAVGFGPSILVWIIPSELVPQNAKSKVYLLVMLVFNFLNGITGFIFYPLEGVAGSFAFLMFIIPLIGFFLFLLFKFPETKRKTSMEIMIVLGFEQDCTKF